MHAIVATPIVSIGNTNDAGRRRSMNSLQRGSGVLDLLALLLLMTLVLLVGSAYLPAEAEDLRAVIALAEPSPAAKAVLVASLKDTPNPTRAQLHRMKVRANEIVVAEMARTMTRDATIETPGQRSATPELAASQPKSWMELSNEERAEFLASNWPIGVVLIAVVWLVGLFGWRRLREAYMLDG